MSTGVNSEYRCYKCSLHYLHCCPFPWYSQHIVPVRSQKSSQSLSRSEFVSVYVCMSWSHLSWCSWVKERILLFLDGKLPATERSGYKSAALSSLLKKHVPALCSYVGRWNFLASPLFFFSSIQIRILHRYDQLTFIHFIHSIVKNPPCKLSLWEYIKIIYNERLLLLSKGMRLMFPLCAS